MDLNGIHISTPEHVEVGNQQTSFDVTDTDAAIVARRRIVWQLSGRPGRSVTWELHVGHDQGSSDTVVISWI